MILGACSAGSGKKLHPVNLPDRLECPGKVARPALKAGMDARLAIAKYDASLNRANERIQCRDDVYRDIRKRYAK